jgi:hypothetical protein
MTLGYLVLDPQNESQKTMLEAQDVLLEAAVDLGFSPTELPRVAPPSRPMKATTLNPAKLMCIMVKCLMLLQWLLVLTLPKYT